jgi:hypothetical protein
LSHTVPVFSPLCTVGLNDDLTHDRAALRDRLFTYPLKFLFSFATNPTAGVIRADQLTLLYAIYALGYAAVFTIFLLLHLHALRKRESFNTLAFDEGRRRKRHPAFAGR